ncbi:RNA-directed DNA polymerase [Roseinatronobacter sp. S2]|uniref:RNA-directed DNA polymerase n=1 Tax=Roseinatronobacter sp. S2 TaxID=3035471 RepID=UPI0024104292|nr:RNA-directed DNA polymerase [Roseinatronobacter sp. S2]WFE73638.1 RNA-directed DNA polymerase [Roseinatronobacter sp. S2]
MNKSERFKVLLEKGYFPAELPPPFVTETLARFRNSIHREWSALDQPPKTRFESYSYPRVGRRRRTLAIVNPISQLFLLKRIADDWIEIKKFLGTSKITLDSPILYENSSRAIPKPDFNLISLKRIDTEARYEHILISDISRFYGTIYTHTLPWALHTKAFCKANLNNRPVMDTLLGSALDALVRKGQDNQTIGIPIGPDTSRILAEIIAVGVERELISLFNFPKDRVFRYVDDWFIGFDGAGEAEDAISLLSRACSEYELELNDEKTSISDPIDPIDELWPSELREHRFRVSVSEQAHDIRHYFTKAFFHAARKRDQNVLDFALKRIRSVHIQEANASLFESYVVRAARVNPTCFPAAAQILINLRYRGFPLSMDRIEKLIFDTISNTALVGRHGELSWALFLAKGLRMSIPVRIIEPVLSVENSVCALITLDLKHMGLISGAISTSFWETFMTSDALTGSMWLLAYEADQKNWLPSPHGHVDAHPFFAALKRRGVFFYDTNKNVPTFQRSIKRQMRENERRLGNFNMLRLMLSTNFRSM